MSVMNPSRVPPAWGTAPFGNPPSAPGCAGLGSLSATLPWFAFSDLRFIDYLGINASRDLLKDSLQWSSVSIAARTSLFNTVNLNVNSVWDPYAVDPSGQRINRSERSVSGALARMLYTNVALGFDIKSKRYGQPTSSTTNNEEVVKDSDPSKGANVNFNMPWRLGVNYSYDVSRAYADGSFSDTQRQSALFNGDVTVLKYWKLGFSLSLIHI